MWVRSLPYLSLCLPFFLNPKLSSHGLECYECRDLKKTTRELSRKIQHSMSQGPVARILCDPESLKVSLINLRRIYKYYGGKMRASCCDYDYCNTFESTIKNLVVDESRKSWKEDYRVIGKKVSKRPLKATENLFLTTHNLSSLTTPYSNILQSLSTATSVTMSLEYDYDIIENDLEIFGNDHIHSEDDIKEGHDKYFNEIVDPRLPENNLFRTSYLKPEDEKSGVGRMNYCFYRVSLILLVFASKIMTQCE
ncbi:unnamed protein product [Lepeophtheirus salmonis]|uniref:(salmon louse) hypothetical protein n=1 Tax=Lepeophtheirus salmonis TaxID=72036 RepID=A0A7R8CHV4_LEPSM|nr:unnamed protein product [Lepeophtheirus salmonis]CAF2826852.1 unnamed protein product [Lepeophtheirus salmonis]